MKYEINNLPKKVKVVRENSVWKVGSILEGTRLLDTTRQIIYLGLEAGILEPYDKEEEDQEKMREEITKNIMKRWGEFETWENVIKEVIKNYKITKK